MYNNTILGNINTSYVINAYPGDLKLEGNIILGNSMNIKDGISNLGTEAIYSRWSKIDYKNNILPCICDMGDVNRNSIDESVLDYNIFSIYDNTKAPEELKNTSNRNKEILTALFDGSYDEETGLFTPVLEDVGLLTPVVVLKNDVLPDGTSIRFEGQESISKDQFGADRDAFTCMGSLELCTDDIDVEWEPKTYNVCGRTLGRYEIHYSIKDNEKLPYSNFYGIVKNENGKSFKSDVCNNELRSGYIKFSDLPVGKYSGLKFYMESGVCKEIHFHDGDALIPTSFEIFSSLSLATVVLDSKSDAKCSDKGVAVFTVTCSTAPTNFEVVDDEGNKVDEFEVSPCASSTNPMTPGIVAKEEIIGVENLKAGRYHVRYAGCDENLVNFEIDLGATFSATAKLLKTCKSSPARVVLEIEDIEGNPAKGTFSFHNPEYPEKALEEKDGNPNNSEPKDNVRMFGEGKYLIQDAGRPANVILVSDGTCEIEVPTINYTATEEDLKINVKGATPKFCAGDKTGSIEFSYDGFKGGDYYDVSISYGGLNRPVDLLYGEKNSLVIEGIEPGEYRITARITTGYIGCDISDGDIYDEVITLEEPAEMSVTPSVVPCTCNESNGSVEFVITGWNATSENAWKFYNKADAASSNEVQFSKTVTSNTDGTVSVTQTSLASGEYVFEWKDGCGKIQKESITIFGTKLECKLFNTLEKESEKCNVNDRAIHVEVLGDESSSYIMDLKDESGNTVEKKTITTPYSTAPLPNGTYKAVISNLDETCSITTPSVTLSSKFTVALTSYNYTSCPNSTSNLRLVVDVKSEGTNTIGSELSFTAVDGDGVESEIPSTNIRPLENGKYVLIHVPSTTEYIITSDGTCDYVSYIKDAAKGTASTDDISAKILPDNQTCYEESNAKISVDFSNMSALYDINFTLTPEVGDPMKMTSYAESDKFIQDKLSAGTYIAKVWVAIENCNLSTLFQDFVTIEAPESDLKISEPSISPIKCAEDGAVSLKVTDLYINATYQYAFYKKGTTSPTYSKLTIASDNTFSYNKENLPAGTYEFAVKDGCSKTFTKEVVIANEGEKALIINEKGIVGYSCIEAKNGSASFSVENWTDECTATFDGVSKTPISVADGVAQFKFENLAKESCVFAVVNGCGKSEEKTVSLGVSKLKIKEFKIWGSEKTCDDDNHKLFVSVSGGNTDKYNYQFFDSKDNIVEEVTGKTDTYKTNRLLAGTYSVKVSIDDVCSVTSGTVKINPGFSTTLSKLDIPECDAKTQRVVVEIVKESEYDLGDEMQFYNVSPENENDEITDKSRKLDENKYLLTGVPVNSFAIATSDSKCTSVADLSAIKNLSVSLPDVTSEIGSVNQTCYKTTNGSVSLKYSDMDDLYDLTFSLEKEDKVVKTEQTSAKSGTLSFDNVIPGTYTAKAYLTAEGCVLSDVKSKEVTITSPAEKFIVSLKKNNPNNCSSAKDVDGKPLYNGSVLFGFEGWNPGYKWTIFKGTKGDEPENLEYTSDVDKSDNGEIQISKANLSAGDYVLRVIDGCETIENYEFVIDNNLYKEYTYGAESPIPYTCVEASNGVQVFNIGNWEDGDNAVLKWTTEDNVVKELPCTPTKKEKSSLVSFSLENLRDYEYHFVISGVCNRTLDLKVNLISYSDANRSLGISLDFDEEDAKCDIEKRKIVAKAIGTNNGDYIFEILDKDGKQVVEKKQTESTFTSEILPLGTYSVKVTTKDVCSAESKKITISSFESIKAYRKTVDCGVIQTLFIVESDNEIKNVDIYAVSRSNKSQLLGSMQNTKSYSRTLSSKEVPLWTSENNDFIFDYIKVVRKSDGCETLISLEEYEEDNKNPFDGVTIPISNTPQKCVNANDGSILVNLKDVNTKYNILMTVENVDTKKKFNGEQQESSTVYMVKDLAPGEYKVSLDLAVGECPLGVSLDLENQTIEKLDKLVVEKLPLHHTRCANDFVDTAIVKLTGWEDGLYHWIYKLENSKLSDDNVEFYEAAIAPDNHIAVFPRHPGQASITFYDGCENVVEKAVFDIPAPDVDFKIDDDIFNPKKAACDISYRSLKLDLSGSLDDNIKYTLTSGNEIIDEGETIAGGKYVSPMLPNGKLFHFEAVTPQGCKVTYDTEEELYSLVPYDAFKTEVTCGGEMSTMILVKHENPLWDAWIYLLESDGSWTSLEPYMLNGKFKTTVKNKSDESYHYIKVLHNECETLVELDEYVEDGDPLSNIEPEIIPIPQSCYGVSNGHITAKYESVDSEYDVIFSATSVEDENYVVYGKDILPYFCVIDSLPVGKYNVKMHLSVGGCPLEGKFKDLGDFEVINLVTKPLVIKEHKLTQSDCFTDVNFKPNVVFYFENFITDLYHWQYSVGDVKSGVFHHDLNNTIYIEPPTDGHLVFTVKDNCADSHPDDHIWTVEDDVIRQKVPTISVKEDRAAGVCPGNGTSLLVEFDNALKGKGRIYAECNSADNANFMEELPAIPDLPKSGKLRIYDFQYGKYGEAYSYTYDLNENVERKLIPAIYTVGYQNTDEKCAGEVVFKRDTIRYPIRLKMAVRDVLCESMNEAAVCFVPERLYSSNVNYTIHQDADSDRGSNWVELLGKSAAEQRTEFEKKFVLGLVDKDHPFRSNVFEDIKEIRIAPTPEYKKNQEALDEAINNKEGRMKYPLPEFRLGNDIDRVVSDYFGLRLIPAGEYVISTTDMEGCTYTDTFEVKGPKYPLAIYDPEYDTDGYCDADKRRISFKAIGGWTKESNESSYDFYLIDSNKKVDEFNDNDKSTGSLILDNDYVGLSKTEALPPVTGTIKTTVGSVVKNVEYKDAHSEKFTSPILTPGTYNLVVIDSLGCMATLEAEIEIKAKYTLDGKTVLDKCNPLEENRLYPEVKSGNQDVTSKVSSYKLRIGHATECVGYPFGCFALGHVHECYPDAEHPERSGYTNCVAMESRNVVQYKENDGTSGNAITMIPKGKIGVFAVMDDGCTAFNEFEYYTKGKQKLTLTNLETFAAKCNGVKDVNAGFLHFQLFGGNEEYTKITLDDETIVSNEIYAFISHPEKDAFKDTIMVDMMTMKSVMGMESPKMIDVSVEEAVKTKNTELMVTHLMGKNMFESINFRFIPLEDLDGVVDKEGNVNYDYLELKYKSYKNTYSFVLPKLTGTTEYSYDENGRLEKNQGKPHTLTVTDKEGCKASLEFYIEQPQKLEVFPDASMPCPDGVGRIITSNTIGGISPYRWSVDMFTTSELNKIFNKDKSEDLLPKDLDGNVLDKESFLDYYQNDITVDIEDRGVAVDRIPADVNENHTVYAYDANGCIASGVQKPYSGKDGDWNNVKTDYLVAKYHNYNDVFVLTDNSYYDVNRTFEDNNPDANSELKGFDGNPFVYDSMRVEIKFNTSGMTSEAKEFVDNLIIERKPASMFVYGVKEGETILFEGKEYEGPIWGVPSEIASSVISDDKYDEYSAQLASKDKVLDDYAEIVAKTTIFKVLRDEYKTSIISFIKEAENNEEYKNELLSQFDGLIAKSIYSLRIALKPKNYLGEVINEETGERKGYSIERIEKNINDLKDQILNLDFWTGNQLYNSDEAFNESLIRYYNTEREYESAYGKIDGKYKLSQVTEGFQSLIDKNEAEVLKRMAFIKFTKSDKEIKNNKDQNVDIDKLFKELKENKISFGIKVTTFISGCDLITELNGLYVLNQDTLPYDSPNYKTTIELTATPNPAVDGKTTIGITTNKAITPLNLLHYEVISVDGKTMKKSGDFDGTGGTKNTVASDNGGTIEEFIYSISLSDLNNYNGYVFVSKFGDRTESIKILTKE